MPPSRATAANVQKKKSTLKDYTGEVKQELQMDPHSCALIAAARRGDVLFGMLAMDAGDTVNTVNNEEETALHIALDSSKQDFALWLLSRGANPCLKDSRGQDCRLWANEIMGVRAALHRAKEREERGALAPQSADVMALADHLGVAGAGDEHLVWVAEAALNAPLPPDWVEHTDDEGAVFYYNKDTGKSTWDHPMDVFYRALVGRLKKGDRSWIDIKGGSKDVSPAAARGKSGAGLHHRSPKDANRGAESGASSALGGKQSSHSSAPTPASELSKNITPDHRGAGGGAEMRGRPPPVNVHHGGGGNSTHSMVSPAPASDGSGAHYPAYGGSPPKSHSPAAVRPYRDYRGEEAVRGSHESGVGGGHKAAEGKASEAGYAGQMKAIMDAREREMQIQAKAQALEAARKARAELTYDQVKRLRHVDTECKNLRRHWALLREALREELLWGPGKLSELRDACVRLVQSVSGAAQARSSAEEAASRERFKVEQLRNEMQQVRGNIRVFCRVRPPRHDSYHSDGTCSFPDEDSIAVTDRDGPLAANGKPALKRFTFDRIYTPKAAQEYVYQDVKPLTMSVLDGYNCCVFAYGQTGTGKTYTMQGPAHDPGVTHRAVKELFDTADRAAMHGYSFAFRISVLEIYNERIFDLLVDPRTAQERRKGKDDLAVHVDMIRGVRVEGLTEIGVENTGSVLDIIQLAQSNRSIGITSANEHSSRSHLIVTLYVHKEDHATGKQVHGKLHLVDLAGSERQAKAATQGSAALESRNINRSLSALHDVISALSNKDKHVPYRNSKLTQMLQDSLAGNSKVLMFVMVSSSAEDVKETMSSLTLAKRVKAIELGGAKKGVENEQLNEMLEGHARQTQELQGRIKSLEAQLVTALSAAQRSKGDGARKLNEGLAKSKQETQALMDQRDAQERARIEAERQAASYKAQLMLAQSQLSQQQMAPRPPAGARAPSAAFAGGARQHAPAGGDLSRADMLFAAGDDEAAVNRSVMGSVMGSNAGDFVEGQRLQGWKQRVAELKVDIEQRAVLESKLRFELKEKTQEVKELKDRLSAAIKRLQDKPEVYDIISNPSGDNRPLYERVNALPRVGGGSSVSSSRLGHATPRGVAGPMSDRSHYKRRAMPNESRMHQLP